MRYFTFLIISFALLSCGGDEPNNGSETINEDKGTGVEFDDYNQKISYCIGLDHGRNIYKSYTAKDVVDLFDIREIKNGMVDYLVGSEVRIMFWEKDSLLDLYILPTGEVSEEFVSKSDASYCIGLDAAFILVNNLVSRKIDQVIDVDYMIIGVEEAMQNLTYPTMAYMDAKREVEKYYSNLNTENGEEFMEQMSEVEGAIKTESGLIYEVMKVGTGATPNLTDSVTMHYTGRFIDGRVFQSTIPANEPYTNTLLNLIPGWQEGLLLMKVGGQNRLYIPPALAYGSEGQGVIEPNSTLVFDVELLEVKRFQ